MSSVLEQAKELAERLSPEDRATLFQFLMESFLDRGSLKGAKENERTTIDENSFGLISTSTAAVITYKNKPVLQVLFDPETFRQSRVRMRGWKDAPPSAKVEEEIQSTLRLHGMPELQQSELEALYKKSSLMVFEAETDRIARELSARLPHMAQLLFDAGVTIVEVAVRNDFAEHTGQQKKPLEEVVKILEPYWEHIKAHLNLASGNVTATVDMGEIQSSKYFFDVKTEENSVIGHIGGVEVFRLTFNPQSYVENFDKSFPHTPPSEAMKSRMRSVLAEKNVDRSDEDLDAATQEVADVIMRVVRQQKAAHIAERITENLDALLIAVMEDAVKAYALESTIMLNEQAGKTIPIGQFKEAILKQHWSRIRDLAGIKRGGARKRKGFVWSDEKKIAFYKTVESFPRHKEKTVWQSLLDELREQAFDAEQIRWHKKSPVLRGVSEELIDAAIKSWRKYLESENWNEMKPDDRPRAFEFRHALSLLEYPDDFTYSTLETYYYEGKRLSDEQTNL